MRHLFVPACCLGLLTGGGAVGPEISLAKLPDAAVQSIARADADIAAPLATADAQAQAAAARATSGYTDQYEIPDPIAEPVPPSPKPLKPIVKPIVPRSREEVCNTLTQAAQSNNLPAPFFIRLLYQESGFRPGTVSPAGAEGVAQFMPETAADRGLDNPYDPVQAISAAASLLRDLAQRFGNLGLAAAAYNAGPGRISAWLAKKTKLPQETKDYVKIITGRPAEGWTAAERGSPAIKLPRHAPCQQAAGLLAWDGPDRIPMPLPDARKAPPPHGNDMLIARAHAGDHKHVAGGDAVKRAGKDKNVAAVAAKGEAKEEAKPAKHKERDAKERGAKERDAKAAAPKPKHRHIQLSER
ncbi:MAG TPA: lytic transglycosylase domain-containing protein [Pseudolabrys sp.]|nr:lytic transglycosylase domain-containing protein [Pseudolabrys sp.]